MLVQDKKNRVFMHLDGEIKYKKNLKESPQKCYFWKRNEQNHCGSHNPNKKKKTLIKRRNSERREDRP